MDELQLAALANKCKLLKFKFMGVYAANIFPTLKNNSFQIVNASSSTSIGTHWLLFCKRGGGDIIFADPLGFKLDAYGIVYRRAIELYDNVHELLHVRLQPLDSSACGLYCLYLAHEVFSRRYPTVTYIGETDLHRFVQHMS